MLRHKPVGGKFSYKVMGSAPIEMLEIWLLGVCDWVPCAVEVRT